MNLSPFSGNSFSFWEGKKTSITVDPGQLPDAAVYGTVLGSALAY